MKTIKEAAKEYSEMVNEGNVDYEHPFCSKTYGQISEEDFKAGVEFVQRWIPAEEELPIEWMHRLSEAVITKDDFNTFSVRFYDYELKRWSGYPLNPVTHWRPIELK